MIRYSRTQKLSLGRQRLIQMWLGPLGLSCNRFGVVDCGHNFFTDFVTANRVVRSNDSDEIFRFDAVGVRHLSHRNLRNSA